MDPDQRQRFLGNELDCKVCEQGGETQMATIRWTEDGVQADGVVEREFAVERHGQIESTVGSRSATMPVVAVAPLAGVVDLNKDCRSFA
jgi:hypothetical protein